MKVLAVIPGDGQGASMIFCRRQVDDIERAGVVVRRFFLRTRTSPVGVMQEWARLRSEIREFAPDVVHAHFGTMTGWMATCATRRPVVVTFRGSDLNPIPSGSWWRTPLGHFLSQCAARRATGIVCVSRELQERLRSGLRKAEIIPVGVDVGHFRPMPRNQARALLNWGHSDPVLLFNAGREPRVKRIDLAEAAYAEARKSVSNLRFEVMRGATHPEQVPLFMNAADALLVTSDYEGSPNIVKEALACGLPIASVRVGDVPERLAGVVPSLIAPREAAALASAVCSLLSDGRRSNGPFIVSRDLSNDAIARRLVATLERARTSSR